MPKINTAVLLRWIRILLLGRLYAHYLYAHHVFAEHLWNQEKTVPKRESSSVLLKCSQTEGQVTQTFSIVSSKTFHVYLFYRYG
jgi:hypothetical protein